MLTLNDGRIELWQWDTSRKLTVDADCSQVHFSNKVFGRSIDVDVVDGVAVIPDILLQTDKDLNVWAFVGTPENGYTKISMVFKVNRRNKPADYVFTPTEQTSLEEIKEKIEHLESIQDPDAIKNAVEDYLEKNPVEAPVQSVNGKTGKVKLTAEDVRAISQDDLQEATNKALKQAKESGDFDGAPGQPGKDGVDGKDGYTPQKGIDYFDGDDYVLTDADKAEIAEMAADLVEVPESEDGGINITGATVGQTVKISEVDENGVPTAWESVDFPSGGSEKWVELVNQTVTISEAVSTIEFALGTTKRLKKFWLEMALDKNMSDSAISGYWQWKINGQSFGVYWIHTNPNTQRKNVYSVKGEYMGNLLHTFLGSYDGSEDHGFRVNRSNAQFQTQNDGHSGTGVFTLKFSSGTYVGKVRCLIKAVVEE